MYQVVKYFFRKKLHSEAKDLYKMISVFIRSFDLFVQFIIAIVMYWVISKISSKSVICIFSNYMDLLIKS